MTTLALVLLLAMGGQVTTSTAATRPLSPTELVAKRALDNCNEDAAVLEARLARADRLLEAHEAREPAIAAMDREFLRGDWGVGASERVAEAPTTTWVPWALAGVFVAGLVMGGLSAIALVGAAR